MLTQVDFIYILSAMNKRISKEKQALILAALCEGAPIEAVARMFKAIGAFFKGESFSDVARKAG